MADGDLPLASAVSSIAAEIGETHDPGWASLLVVVDKKIREYETTKALDSAHFGIKFSILANDAAMSPRFIHEQYSHIFNFCRHNTDISRTAVQSVRIQPSGFLFSAVDWSSAGALPTALHYSKSA
ncbi:uncharacterized protein ARMOST_18996 [Armillaria ostoyae]|uniref:Uncharacterized protein n=1 Tax=Armillaria ostoyae TaxID=47428 RepID=A0A284S3A7_ARMOS|nr:uncharacterized protein ARMOST_18996 [Armillaria ostoyae]